MKRRVQLPGETGISYALEKAAILCLAPHAPTAAQSASLLINGLAKWEHVASMTSAPPLSVAGFIDRLRELEALGIATVAPNYSPGPLVYSPAPEPQHIPSPTVFLSPSPLNPSFDVASALASFEAKKDESTATVKQVIGNRRGGPDPSKSKNFCGKQKCYGCGGTGHIRQFARINRETEQPDWYLKFRHYILMSIS